MKIINICLTVFIFIFLVSCAQRNNDELDNISSHFSSYISSVHNLNIPDSLHYFIILSAEGCMYCFKSVFISSNNLVQSKNNITLIVSILGKNIPQVLKDISYSEKILFEFKSEYSKSPLGYLGNTIFVTKNHKLIKYIQFENEKDLLRHFNALQPSV